MIKVLSDEQSASFIEENFKKGDILRWESYKGAEKIKDRFFILLTSCINEDFLAVTATSQVQLYLPDGKRKYNKDVIFVGVGECKEFDRDTILDFNWIETFSLLDMAKLFGVGITRTGSVSPEIMNKIDNCVAGSILISKIVQKKILGDKYEKFNRS